MAFGSNNFNGASKSFDGGVSKGFKSHGEMPLANANTFDNPFKFTPTDDALRSRIRFYDRDSLWARWRRGYELFTITHAVLGSFADQRANYGDFRMYCAYQLFPGLFIPLRIFAFPTQNQEIASQLVGIRDANSINFYDYGLSILGVRYLGDTQSGTYTQSGTTITVTVAKHGYQPNDNVYLNFTSGSGVTTTLPIVSKTDDTFICTAAASVNTSGNVSVALSTTFGDTRWTNHRVKLRSLFSPITSLVGERLVDRVVERDPGISATYSRTGTTVTVTCSQAHGLSTGNIIFAAVSSGNVTAKRYTVTVTSSTGLQFTTPDSGTDSGNMVVSRLIQGFSYGDYVGYTLTGLDNNNNELIFQRADSYGTQTVSNQASTTVPATRGFAVGRFLTTEIRYQCTCQDYSRRAGYNLFHENPKSKFPVTPITSTKPGSVVNKDNTTSNSRDQPGTYSDLGYLTTTAGFYKLPDYQDKGSSSFTKLYYYQHRWCKHIYAALFSINHDDGSMPVLGSGRYTQSGPTVTVSIANHGLKQNGKIQINFTSGAAVSGEYSVSQVVDANTFQFVYPYSLTSSGYCNITNLQRHAFVDPWLIEPSDKPVGDDLDTFYKNFDKEHKRVNQAADRLRMVSHGIEWSGTVLVTGTGNQPKQVADYSTRELSMYVSDNLRRSAGEFDNTGTALNNTQRLTTMMSQLLNIDPSRVLNQNFGMLDQPLYNYDSNYQSGKVDGGQYLNGRPYSVPGSNTTTSGTTTEDPNTVTTLDCLTYDPSVSQDLVVDAGYYNR